ncbi:hypothetical protein Glove_319g108 [Diversispora epigaea]|uniref:Protein kinase domain-containing protein n=1 Tax=Diversispora epigaea TaxID=1348612 RepID=A0A397HPF7_9GLOM|nr:hypothetical protein Glove_319g108 [Diversispora epigaea]
MSTTRDGMGTPHGPAFKVYRRAKFLMDPTLRLQSNEARSEFLKKQVEESNLDRSEKNYLYNLIDKEIDINSVLENANEKRTCKYCNNKTSAKQYCEFCIRKYLENNFKNWTSGNNEIDKLLQTCQKNVIRQDLAVEWVPFEKFSNVKYLSKGGFADIYTAEWNEGCYDKWDSKNQQYIRYGKRNVVLKSLRNSKNPGQQWISETEIHLNLMNKLPNVVFCYGITKDPHSQDFMLILRPMECDLNSFLKTARTKKRTIPLLQKINILYDIAFSLNNLHKSNNIHKDLHPGNVLLSGRSKEWLISDLGFCGPVERKPTNIYGVDAFIDPEVYLGEPKTKKSDIYAFGMLMWEIYYEKFPFKKFYIFKKFPYSKVIDGKRPGIKKGMPTWYSDLLKKCWDAIPDNRPNVEEILVEIEKQLRFLYQQPGATKDDDFYECDYKSVICFPTHSSKHPLLTSSPKRIYFSRLSISKLKKAQNVLKRNTNR